MDVLHILSVLVLLTVVSVDSLMFHLAANQKKCLKEEIHKDVLVTGEYQLSDVPGHKTQLLVQATLYLFMESYMWIFISTKFGLCVSYSTTSLNACLYTVPNVEFSVGSVAYCKLQYCICRFCTGTSVIEIPYKTTNIYTNLYSLCKSIYKLCNQL